MTNPPQTGMTQRATAAEAVTQRIAESGPIPFAEFMELALYGVGGYYAVDRPRIGADGDFVTGSRSWLFAAATLRLLQRLDESLANPAQLLEVGFGDARHLQHLADSGRSGLYAHDRVRRSVPTGVEWVENLETVSINGVVFSYELFDALPVHRLVVRDGELRELFVTGEGSGGFEWIEQPLSDPGLVELSAGAELAEGQIIDVTPAWAELYGRMAKSLHNGLIITFDYGYPRQQLFDPRVRKHGTLACYRQHTVHRNPLVDAGRQDLTAHVDFTTLQETGEAEGLRTWGFLKLAEWLTAMGIFDQLQDADRMTTEEAHLLLDPAGMGSEIKVLIQARGEFDLGEMMPSGPP